MNIVYIIGNGFDISLGLKTSYKNFLDYYLKQPYNNHIIGNFKEDIKNDISRDINSWSDLELKLGEYASQVETVDKYAKIYDNIYDEICSYIELQQNKFSLFNYDTNSLDQKLNHPFHEFKSDEGDAIVKSLGLKVDQKRKIDFVNFNYTNTLHSVIYKLKGNSSFTGGDIYHPHGQIEKNVLLGVNDISQINNDELNQSDDIKLRLVKPQTNQELSRVAHIDSLSLIGSADIICIYGSSMGVTDRLWWNEIMSHINSTYCHLIIFEHNPNINTSNRSSIFETIKKQKITKTKLIEDYLVDDIESSIDEIKQRIHICYNSEIFKLSEEKIVISRPG